ncbi:MAG: hypothetical protein LCH53_06035 [Bacteroidetes bacterium]|nr:hypothetical protein [Bacteroidota bacterium]
MTISIDDKIKALRRELAMRYRVYPNRVQARKMTQAEADREVAIAEAILQDYVDERARRAAAQTTLPL